MLFGNINQLDLITYTEGKLAVWIREAVALANGKPDGKYELTNSEIFVVVVSAETENAQSRKAEVHKKYIDVQLLLEGEEQLGYSNILNKEIATLTEFENDVKFIDDVENEQFVQLRAGDFALFYPHQVHRPLCALSKPMSIKKAIIKIPNDLF